MDNIKYDFDQEIEAVIDEVVSLYDYDEDMRMVLSKITKTIVGDRSYEDRQLFYKALRTTPIVVLDPDTTITEEELSLKMNGRLNPHIKEKEGIDTGEYGKQSLTGGGGFVTDIELDKDLNIIGEKNYIYVDGFDKNGKLDEQQKKFLDVFNTGINVSHLIHELGHAYASQYNAYTVEKNDGETIITHRQGTCTTKHKYTPLGNGEYESELIAIDGLYIEEGLNSNEEENNLAKYLGISLEEAMKLYGDVLIKSVYQPVISNMTRRISNAGFKQDLNKWREKGDQEALGRINEIFSGARYYKIRGQLFERIHEDTGDPDSEIIAARNQIFNHPEPRYKSQAGGLLKRLEKDFFPETEDMTPMDMMNNILLQLYDISCNRGKFSVERLKKFVLVVKSEGIGMIDQAKEILMADKTVNQIQQTQ